MTFTRFGQLACLPLEPRNGVSRVAVQTSFALDIEGQLFNALTKRFDRLARLIFLIFQGITLNLQPLQHRRRNCLFLAQRWQPLFQLLPLG